MKNLAKTVAVAAVLSWPASAAIAQDVMYIPLGSTGEIVVIDTARDEVVGKIEGLPAVHGLAGTPDGDFLVAGSYDERDLGIKAPPKPEGVSEDEHAAHHAKPSNVSATPTVSTVSVVRTSDHAITRRIDVPGAVHHVAISPDGAMAAVTQPGQGTITAIDLKSYEVAATVATGPQPNYAVFSPDGGRLYVSNAGNDTVSEVNVGRWIVQRNIVVGASPEHIVLSREGTFLYVNNVDDGTVSVVDLARRDTVKTIEVGQVLHGIDLSDDGTLLFVAALADDKLVAVDLATGAYRSAYLSPEPYHLSAVRGQGKVYVSSAEQPKVWVLDQATLDVRGEIAIGGKGHQMVLVPGS
jgi:YVTN family beta-propeller protein